MEDHIEILEKLKKQFEDHNTSVREYEDQILPKMVMVKWATEPQLHLELLKIERARLSKGKVYPERNSKTSVKLGYDSQGRIIYEEEEGKSKMFVSYEEDSIWAYKFSHEKIDSIECQTLEQGLPKTFASYRAGVVNTVDKYEYQNARLVKIESYSSYEAFGRGPQTPTYHIGYNKLGDVSEMVRKDEPSDFFPNGQNLTIYKKSSYSIKALTEILVSEMEELIKQELQNGDLSRPKALLIFTSNTFNSADWFPPLFSVATPKSLKTFDISIDEFIDLGSILSQHPISDRLAESSNLLMQEIELKEKYELPDKILMKIAKEIKSWWQESSKKNDPLLILPMDFPDDLSEKVSSLLQRIHSKYEIRKLKETNDNNN